MYPLTLPAIRVSQPLGDFYVCTLSAEILLQVAFSDPARARMGDATRPYFLSGSQRVESESRLREIARYIDTTEAAFPNAIILSANSTPQGELVQDEATRWRLTHDSSQRCSEITIPTDACVAAIVDGQHRLHAFRLASSGRRSTEMLCAVYFDLPLPFQAYLFATINFNQKKVDRGLAYELFGFNLDEEPLEAWSPDKAAVFFVRKLNIDAESPLRGRIRISAIDDEQVGASRSTEEWSVSTATVVDGMLALFSSNPSRDRVSMYKTGASHGRTRRSLSEDRSPLRKLYLDGDDIVIYTTARNFFTAVANVLWSSPSGGSYIRKNVGIQALFDLLKQLLLAAFERDQDVSVDYFRRKIEAIRSVDFADEFFQASGKGRVRIKNVLLLACGLTTLDRLTVSSEDLVGYERIGRSSIS